ncbi:MAG TPA: hypothetical protein VJJ98_02545 [Sedimentisphaerales bacterium]|nr:hypothetical protein [Sedimentisphaerales bacterium]
MQRGEGISGKGGKIGGMGRRQNTGDRRQSTENGFTRAEDASKSNPEGMGCRQMQRYGMPTLSGWVF